MYRYKDATSRNIGWVTEKEQAALSSKRVAIAGLGGVGGAHLLTLSRLGITRFNISDFDSFEMHNLNRQAGAFISTIDQKKLSVMNKMALDINPESDIRTFSQGVNESNIDTFLQDVDLYVDSLDFFALSARRMVFQKCAEKGIPAITAAPLGMGCAFLAFIPGGMTFEEYFRLEGHTDEEQLIKLLIGLSPSMMQRSYLVDRTRADFRAQKGPSTPMAVDMCAGITGTNALKILLGRGDIIKAPFGLHFDAYANTLKRTWRPGGNKNPLQIIAFRIASKLLL